ncbi:MAG: class I SAM-dependent methyltransferase [Simkaniaceae bacterium]|nr:class I SAM-dependent methyltransferase [Simkaniaceae bacterium]
MKEDAAWAQVSKWYDEIVSKGGHTYHKGVIFPELKKWYSFKKTDAILDLGCGQGILAREFSKEADYLGIDVAKPLIQKAKGYSKHRFIVGNVTKPLNLEKKDFSHVFIILALQNMEDGEIAIRNGAKHLRTGGKLILILNHPCFRLPRQSSWAVDDGKKLQYRRIDRYCSPMKIPIQMHPSKKERSEKTFSYHHPISTYVEWMVKSGLVITKVEEWCSHKSSIGKWAKMENRARKEFPLFLALEGTIG